MLESYERLFRDDDLLQGALELMYVDILNFHETAIGFFRHKCQLILLSIELGLVADSVVWNRVIRSMWKDFDTKFKGILESLGRHKTFVDTCAQRAQYHLYQQDNADTRATSLARFQQHQRDVQEQNAKLDKLVVAERERKTQVVRQWLAAGKQSTQDHDLHRQIRKEHSKTTHWIFQQAGIMDWIGPAVPSTPILWMHGIPGAGEYF